MSNINDPMRDLMIQAIEGDGTLAQLVVAYFKILGNTENDA